MTDNNSNYLPTEFQRFIHTSRYAKFIDGRRETWSETVARYIDNVVYNEIGGINDHDIALTEELEQAILGCEVMPSMRALMTAGPALDRSNIAGFNCSYTPIDHPQTFSEVLYILLNGTGVGFSCEQKYVDSLPQVPPFIVDGSELIIVEDSKEGWAYAYQDLINLLWMGRQPDWDLSRVRPAGAPLKTFGGRASGPEPLQKLFDHTVKIFKGAEGRKLTPIEVHSLVCMIGQVVVVGGVRRSALISLSDLGDDDMRLAKSGEWWIDNQHFALSNNSVAYEHTPTSTEFMEEWLSLAKSGSGERGIFNREAAQRHAEMIGRNHRNDFGTNPCSEIVLLGQKHCLTDAHAEELGTPELGVTRVNEGRHTKIEVGEGIPATGGQFCNLTEVVVRATDTPADLERKIRLATILGTIQATLTSFPYLRPIWGENTRHEALLGVSMTGIMDNPYTNGLNGYGLGALLRRLRDVAIETNYKWAKKLGINTAAAVTCVKPSGTVSSLVDSASGIHARHSPFYCRTVRGDNKDPVTSFMRDAGFPHAPCVYNGATTTVFSFPMKAPAGALTRNDMTAIEQLEMWLEYQTNFCCHKPSITVSVRDHEWPEVGAWVFKHFDLMSGVSFLPHSDHTYEQAPYTDIPPAQYERLLEQMPKGVDWSKLADYEQGRDHTTASQELACTGGVCDVVDISSAA